jgi:hypothetical protein
MAAYSGRAGGAETPVALPRFAKSFEKSFRNYNNQYILAAI